MSVDPISGFLQSRVDAGDFPSAVYLVAEKGEIVLRGAIGYAVVEPELIECRADTIYDLASLTKPLLTGLLTASLLEKEALDMSDRVGPFFGRDFVDDFDVKSLVAHISGLPAWKPFYAVSGAPMFNPEDYGVFSESNDRIRSFVLDEILRTETAHPGAARVVYSDLNFILLGFILEELHGVYLPTLALNAFARIGLSETSICGGIDKFRTAASEKGNGYERQTCIEQGYLGNGSEPSKEAAQLFRTDVIWSEVHDGNAYFMGGVAGHAGVFSTAEEVFKIAQQFLPNYTRLLKPETCQLFRTNLTEGLNEDRSFAFQLASSVGSTAGTRMPRESFGHNGFTGTSLWIDPIKERIFVLLTNRTHHHPLPFANINSVRRHFHDLAIELLD